jgi:hypothetical protein
MVDRVRLFPAYSNRLLTTSLKKSSSYQTKGGEGMLSHRIQGQLSLARLTTLVILLSLFFSQYAVAALISANPTQGSLGTQVTVSGSGWTAGDLIHLSWHFPPFNTVASVNADGGGSFSADITVPQEAPIGPTSVDSINEAGDVTWQAPFEVTSAQADTLSFKIEAIEGWKPAGVVVKAGQILTFSVQGDWSVDYRNFSFVGPEGYLPEEDAMIYQGCKFNPELPYGKLLLRAGDDPSFVIIGTREGTFMGFCGRTLENDE